MGTRPYGRIGHVDLFQIVELHNSMSREGSKTDMLQPPNEVNFVASESEKWWNSATNTHDLSIYIFLLFSRGMIIAGRFDRLR